MNETKLPIVAGIENENLALDDEELAWEAFNAAGDALNKAGGKFLSKVHLLPPYWRAVYTLLRMHSQVENGGFHQFFTNAGGVFDSHLLEDVALFKHGGYVDVINKVFRQYQEIGYEDQWANRGKSWDYFAAPYKDGRFHEEDVAFYSLQPNAPVLVGSFVRENFANYVQQEESGNDHHR